MGTLKLSNIKYRTHLKDAIEYIFSPDKTENGKYIFGDSGYNADIVYDTFLSTKNVFGKHDGRQAYHYMLTFAEEDDITPELVQEITEKFMKRLFPDNDYDWAAGVHVDTGHIHSHIIFNSVNRITGLKYRYEKGDWEKAIQKIVDNICNEYGLSTIAYDFDHEGKSKFKQKTSDKKATTYEKFNMDIKNKADVIRQDIDRCIKEANTFDEFLNIMRCDGYHLRQGESKKFGGYITFKPYGVDKGMRSYRLGNGYGLDDIKVRIGEESVSKDYKPPINENRERVIRIAGLPTITFRRYYVKNIYIASRWKNGKPFKRSYEYKLAVIENQKMIDEYQLIRKNNFRTIEDIQQYKEQIRENLKILYRDRKKYLLESDERKALDEEIKEYNFNKRVAARILNRIENSELQSEKTLKRNDYR